MQCLDQINQWVLNHWDDLAGHQLDSLNTLATMVRCCQQTELKMAVLDEMQFQLKSWRLSRTKNIPWHDHPNTVAVLRVVSGQLLINRASIIATPNNQIVQLDKVQSVSDSVISCLGWRESNLHQLRALTDSELISMHWQKPTTENKSVFMPLVQTDNHGLFYYRLASNQLHKAKPVLTT